MIAAAGFFACCAIGVAQAEDVSEQGAGELRKNLMHMLSDDLAKSGFLEIRPAGGVYEVTLDLAKFLDKIGSPDFSITGIQPQTMLVAPLADNLWNIEGNSRFDVAAHSRLGHGPATDVKYSVGSLVYSGVFDPAISYLRSADVTAKDIRMLSTAGPRTIETTAAGMNYKLAAIDSSEPHKIDFHTTGTLPSFYEKISSPTAPDMELRADSLDVDGSASGVRVKEVRDLLRFVFQHVKAKNLSKKGSDRFEDLARAAMPLFTSLGEAATANNLTISTPGGHAGIGKLVYSFKMDGLVNSSHIVFGMRAQDMTVSDGLLPSAYAPLLPQVAEIQFGIPGLNFADAADVLLQADFSKEQPLSKQEGERIGTLVFPAGTVTLEIPKLSAKSGLYDVEAFGKITSDIRRKGHYTLQLTILARDYDKTIAYIQQAGKSEPQLNQVSFGLLMAKGFAKTDPDGRQRWEIAADESGTVTVNGQVMKNPMPH
jgi:hypothetical protein